jgi:hypothetical protein
VRAMELVPPEPEPAHARALGLQALAKLKRPALAAAGFAAPQPSSRLVAVAMRQLAAALIPPLLAAELQPSDAARSAECS